ncbi:MAG: glycosyltransferase [Planctomycetota bacterium]|jgi:glycosyltransferase involved in cell wall biosynthesis|nr:glycosyltransferase [Planctomycetota bacterium]
MEAQIQLVAVMPALDEEGSIGAVIADCFAMGVDQVIIGDNGSTDNTAAVARAAGAVVVDAPVRGYGAACQAALAAVPPSAKAVVFCDADGADDLTRMRDIVDPVLAGCADLVIGSRAHDPAARRALSWPQRTGNMVSAILMRLLYRVAVTDLGPFRCVSTEALARLAMEDPNFGWTAEMQVKAYRLSMRVREVAVEPRERTAGVSKISGNWHAVFRAGWAIITTILKYHRCELRLAPPAPEHGAA